MRIAQILLPDATQYERKAWRIDRAALADRHELVEDAGDADLAHVYAGSALPRASFVGFPVPYVASAPMSRARWSVRRPAEPKIIVTPENLPEAVDDEYFSARTRPGLPPNGVKTVGSFRRADTANFVEQTLHRIERVRSDVRWRFFEAPPVPEDLVGIDLWVDPAVGEDDFDGFVAEALVVGLPVVASRTRINFLRLEKGRTGFVVPPRDPNEMSHAILSALFKPEVAQGRVEAAQQTNSKFRARQRLRTLLHLYDTLIHESS